MWKFICPDSGPPRVGQSPLNYLGGVVRRADPPPRADDTRSQPHAFRQAALRLPLSRLMTTTTNATTSSKWIRPPPTCKLKPRSHRTRRIMQMVQSMANLLCSFASTRILEIGRGAVRCDGKPLLRH